MNKKRLIALLLLLSLWAAFLVGCAAPKEPVLRLSTGEAAPGETVEVTVSFENAPAVSGCHLRLGFDPQVLTPITATCLLEEGQFLSNLSSHHAADLTEVTLVWANAEALALSGQTFTVTFLVGEGAAEGRTALTWKQAELVVEGEKLSLSPKDGGIAVLENKTS